MSILLELFIVFFKIGAFSFGGGYAMIPLIQREIIEKHGWITLEQFIDIVGISQMTPGPIAVNSATFVGYKVAGLLGSLTSTFGVTVVSFILISIANRLINKFKESKTLKAALLGMRPVLIALIVNAFISLAKSSYIDIKSIIIALLIGGCLLSKKVHPIVTIVIAGVLGVVMWGGL